MISNSPVMSRGIFGEVPQLVEDRGKTPLAGSSSLPFSTRVHKNANGSNAHYLAVIKDRPPNRTGVNFKFNGQLVDDGRKHVL